MKLSTLAALWLLIAPVNAFSGISSGGTSVTGAADRAASAAEKQGKEIMSATESDKRQPIVFAVFAEDETELSHALILAESIRTFAGTYSDAPIWIYLPQSLVDADPSIHARATAQTAEIKISDAPEASLRFYYARKTFAAAAAETEADGKTALLVWMDEDTVVLTEPTELLLPESAAFGYRPVMHNRSGSLYSKPPDEFWSRLYEVLNVPEEALFPMVTPADRQTIRPYFNAGLLVVRPERGLLREWVEDFRELYRNRFFVDMCANDVKWRIFLHQTALVGPPLRKLKRDEMVELSDRCNYPIFFKAMYGAEKEFDRLDGIVTLRYDVYFQNPDSDWADKLQGPDRVIAWLREHLGR